MLIIGVSGGTGCGKTTVVEELCSQLPKSAVSVLSQDAYYKDLGHLSREERSQVNFDHPDALDFDLMLNQIKALKEGKSIQCPTYSFVEETRLEKTVSVHPNAVLLVEGILVFHPPALRNLFDLRLYVEADTDERLLRRLRRDLSQRGHDLDKSIQRYREVVKPMYDTFVEPTKAFADLIIPNNQKNPRSTNWIRKLIANEIKHHGLPEIP
jgi:uridine kinase